MILNFLIKRKRTSDLVLFSPTWIIFFIIVYFFYWTFFIFFKPAACLDLLCIIIITNLWTWLFFFKSIYNHLICLLFNSFVTKLFKRLFNNFFSILDVPCSFFLFDALLILIFVGEQIRQNILQVRDGFPCGIAYIVVFPFDKIKTFTPPNFHIKDLFGFINLTTHLWDFLAWAFSSFGHKYIIQRLEGKFKNIR